MNSLDRIGSCVGWGDVTRRRPVGLVAAIAALCNVLRKYALQ